MAKLAETAETVMAITFLVMNLERRLRRFIFLLLDRWLREAQSVVRLFSAQQYHGLKQVF
jgi:hypothetical protein